VLLGATTQALVATSGIWEGMEVPETSSASLGNFTASLDELIRQTAIEREIPGMTVAATRNGRLVYNASFGYADWAAQRPMTNNARARIGSSTKVLVGLTMMHLSNNPELGVPLDTRVYGSSGVLSSPGYRTAYTEGVRRHAPLVAAAIGRDNRVTSWYTDGRYDIGSSEDLDSISSAPSQVYQRPPGQDIVDIVAIARGGSQDRVYSWYRDGSYAVGTPDDLAAFSYVRPGDDPAFESRRIDTIVGIGVHKTADLFYAYYHDGVVTSGDSPANLENRWQRDYTVPGGEGRRYDIVAIDRSANDQMVAWYSDGMASKGSATNLGSTLGLYPYERRAIEDSRARWLRAYEDITIRHLLSHTSGLTRSGDEYQAGLMFGIDLEARRDFYLYANQYVLATRPLLFEPAAGVSYSNHGFGLTGHIIDTLVAGEVEPSEAPDWYAYMREHILEPARARRIYPWPLDPDPFDALPYAVDENEVVDDDDDGLPISAAGSLKATASELARVLVATDRLGNHPDILPAGVLDEMESRPFPGAASSSAHGWQVNCVSSTCSTRRLWHNGSVSGGSSFIAKYQGYPVSGAPVTGVTVSIVANRSGAGGLGGLSDAIARAVAVGTVSGGDLFNPIQ
jgi:CubicO group peptidase (beta-lactamase class C family)